MVERVHFGLAAREKLGLLKVGNAIDLEYSAHDLARLIHAADKGALGAYRELSRRSNTYPYEGKIPSENFARMIRMYRGAPIRDFEIKKCDT